MAIPHKDQINPFATHHSHLFRNITQNNLKSTSFSASILCNWTKIWLRANKQILCSVALYHFEKRCYKFIIAGQVKPLTDTSQLESYLRKLEAECTVDTMTVYSKKKTVLRLKDGTKIEWHI